MKKTFLAIIAVLSAALIITCSLYIAERNGNDGSASEITAEFAVETVKKKLDKKSIATITNFDDPEIEEVIFEKQPSIYFFEGKTDIIGKSFYKITFRTTQDGLLDPMVFYVNKSDGTLTGADYRE